MLAIQLRALAAADHPLQLVEQLEEIIPANLKSLLLVNPRVDFLVTVNAEGKLVDSLPIEATHYELLTRAEHALQRALFTPALVQGHGVQASTKIAVYFFDPEQRAVRHGLIALPYGSTATEGASRRLYDLSRSQFVYRRAESTELDQPITVRTSKVMVLRDEQGQPAVGDCIVDFYINARGEVHLPRVISADNETVALSALLTLQQTSYTPISRRKVPAFVKVRQPMNFAPRGAAAVEQK